MTSLALGVFYHNTMLKVASYQFIDNKTSGGGVLIINTDGNVNVIKSGVSTICRPNNITVFVDKVIACCKWVSS